MCQPSSYIILVNISLYNYIFVNFPDMKNTSLTASQCMPLLVMPQFTTTTLILPEQDPESGMLHVYWLPPPLPAASALTLDV